MVETIITSHTDVAYHVERMGGTPPHHSFSLLISVEYACVNHIPECIVLG